MADPLRAIVHAALSAPSSLEPYRAGSVRRVVDGPLVLVAGGVPRADFNQVLVLGPVAPERVLAAGAAFFGSATGYSVAVEVEAAPEVEAALRGRGWQLDEEEPALALSPIPDAVPDPPADLTIRRVTDTEGLAAFRAVSGTSVHIVPSLAAATDPGVALFVGYRVAEPVATARLGCVGGVAEISGVVTLPAARRRGYGAALTWAAIHEGAARGCTAAALTATAMGYPLYISMGFVPVCTYRTFLPPESGQWTVDSGQWTKRE